MIAYKRCGKLAKFYVFWEKRKNMDGKTQSLSTNEKLLYTQFRRKINTEAAKSQIKKIEYNLADPTVGLPAIKSACSDAQALGMGGVCVLPCFVRQSVNFLGADRSCGVIACISAPHGGDTTDIKVKAVKRAVKDGADEVEVTVPVAHIREGNFSYFKKELKKLRSASKKMSLRIDAECPLLTKEDVAKVCAIAADVGVNSVKTSSGAYGRGNELEMIAEIKSTVRDKCTIKSEGVATVLELSNAVDMGANVVGSRNAATVARSILAAATSED